MRPRNQPHWSTLSRLNKAIIALKYTFNLDECNLFSLRSLKNSKKLLKWNYCYRKYVSKKFQTLTVMTATRITVLRELPLLCKVIVFENCDYYTDNL